MKHIKSFKDLNCHDYSQTFVYVHFQCIDLLFSSWGNIDDGYVPIGRVKRKRANNDENCSSTSCHHGGN